MNIKYMCIMSNIYMYMHMYCMYMYMYMCTCYSQVITYMYIYYALYTVSLDSKYYSLIILLLCVSC